MSATRNSTWFFRWARPGLWGMCRSDSARFWMYLRTRLKTPLVPLGLLLWTGPIFCSTGIPPAFEQAGWDLGSIGSRPRQPFALPSVIASPHSGLPCLPGWIILYYLCRLLLSTHSCPSGGLLLLFHFNSFSCLLLTPLSLFSLPFPASPSSPSSILLLPTTNSCSVALSSCPAIPRALWQHLGMTSTESAKAYRPCIGLPVARRAVLLLPAVFKRVFILL